MFDFFKPGGFRRFLSAASNTRAAMHPERRAWPRYPGPMPVLVLNLEDALDDPYLGRLVDFSQGGVCLVIPGLALEEGTLLGISPSDAGEPVTPFWTEVEVKNCRTDGGETKLGCRFLHRNAFEWPRATELVLADEVPTRIDLRRPPCNEGCAAATARDLLPTQIDPAGEARVLARRW